jgi:hypothetical protein
MSNCSYEYLISSSVAERHMYFTFTNQSVTNGKVHKNNIIFNGPSHIICLIKVSAMRVICCTEKPLSLELECTNITYPSMGSN